MKFLIVLALALCVLGRSSRREEKLASLLLNLLEDELAEERNTCVCSTTWTDEASGMDCVNEQQGCPATACDRDTDGRWCVTTDPDCDEALSGGGWARCDNNTPVFGSSLGGISVDTPNSCADNAQCNPRNANRWMCDPANDNSQMSGNFLSKCPKSCLDAGYDHNQCHVDSEVALSTFVTDAEVENLKASTSVGKPVLLEFWASWNGQVKMIDPMVDEIAEEYRGKVKVVKLNIDLNAETPGKYGVRGVPTLLLFKNGGVAATKVGALSKDQLRGFLNANL